MTTTELLTTFADGKLIGSLSMGDKFTASLITTVLGMGITFTALIILLIMMSWMNKILNKRSSSVPTAQPAMQPQVVAEKPIEKQVDDNEIVAAITTAIAMTLKTSVSNIVIKNIEKVEEQTPQWNRAGLIEQMNNRL
jgi:glutaconyl-CoA/methylmalonyl-CoA decarboxylase subunit delta